MSSKSIGVKLALIMLCVILLGIAITVGVDIIIAGNVITNESLAKIKNETMSEAMKMDGWLSGHKTQVGTIAAVLSRFDDYSQEYMRPIFQAEIAENKAYQEVYIGFANDTTIMGNYDELEKLYAGGWKATQRVWYQLAMTDTSHSHITSPYVDSNTGILCITASRAVIDNRKNVVGVAATDIALNVLQEQIAAVTLDSKDGFAVLLDANGDILVHPDSEMAPDSNGNFKNLSTAQNGAYSKLWEKIKNSDTAIKYRDASGKMQYYTVNTLESTGWKLMTVLPAKVVTKPIMTLILIVIPMTLITMIIAAMIIMRTINVIITKPLNMIIGKLTGSSEIIQDTAIQFSEASENLAAGSSKQAEAIEETSATMNETASMVSLNAENTKIAAQIATGSMQVVNETGKYMAEMMAVMSELRESSDKVNKIVKTIDDIAFQTNLLAINATVEAARTGGDAGRSFAVVAQEVRNLAQKSATSSEESAAIIDKNILLTNYSRQAAEQVLNLAQKNEHQMLELNKLISEISAASEEQAAGIKQINIAVNQMRDVTQENAAVAEENAASSINMRNEIFNLEEAVDIAKNLVGMK